MPQGKGRALWVGMVAQVMAQVVAVHREQVAADLRFIQDFAQAAHCRHPGTQNAVGKTSVAVLVLRAFLLQKRRCLR